MITTVKPRYFNIFHRFTLSLVLGLLIATSLTLVGCTQESQKATNQSAASNVLDTKTSKIKTKLLHIEYQQAGDLIRVTKVLDKRLEPLSVKVEWAQFAQGPQLMEAMNVGKIDLGSVGKTPPIFAQAAGAQIVYVVGKQNNVRRSAIADYGNQPRHVQRVTIVGDTPVSIDGKHSEAVKGDSSAYIPSLVTA